MDDRFDELFRIDFMRRLKEEKKMKFKVGDRVRVIEDLVVGRDYNKYFMFTYGMDVYRGYESIVEEIEFIEAGEYRYKLNGITDYWFSNDMLEPAEFTIKDLQVNDIVTLKNGTMRILHKFDNELFAIDHSEDEYDCLDSYKNDFKETYGLANLGIMRVRRPEAPWQLKRKCWEQAPIIWEEKKKEPYDGKSYEELHRELWNWLADNPTKSKRAWFEEFYPDEKAPLHFCFACEYAKNNTIASDICKKCPICDYKESSKCLNGLYEAWSTLDYSRQLGIKSDIARGIANLKWEDKNGKE